MNETENKQVTLKSSEIGYNGFYLERSGQQAHEMVDRLLAPPENPLAEEQKQEVLAFESSLADAEVAPGVSIEQVIRSTKEENITAPLFFAHAFIEDKIDLSAYGSPSFENEMDVYRWVAVNIKDKTIPVVELRAIALTSLKNYEAEVAALLVEEKPIPVEITQAHSLVVDPEQFAQSAENANAARAFLKGKRREVFSSEDLEDRAKKAVTNVYLSRINEIITQNIPRADYLIAQSLMSEDHDMMRRAIETVPEGMRHALLDARTHKDILKRLDYLRNGIAVDASGSSAIAYETLGNDFSPSEREPAVYTPEQQEILKTTMLRPEELLVIYTNILRRANMLSSEDPSTWSPDRKSRAADNKYQAVINPGQSTFAVDGTSGAFKSASVERSIYDALVVGGFHELSHVNQCEADQELAKTIRIAKLKGKRVSSIREAGANRMQRAAEMRYFGIARPFSSTYAHALKKIEDGGTIGAAASAYFKEKMRISPHDKPAGAAKEAANRVVRLVRQGGLSSQPMVYAEEAILAHELQDASPEEKQRATLITGLDLVDQLKLHEFGLIPEVESTDIDWVQIVAEEFEPYIQRALKSQEGDGQ